MKKISVLIPDGENEHVLWVARSLAASEQIELHILSNERWRPVRFSRHRRHFEFSPSEGCDPMARLHAIEKVVARTPVDVILPVSEEGVLFAVTEQERLAKLAALPPLPSPEALRTARNKWLLNQFAHQHHLPAPPAILVTDAPTFEQQLFELTYPVLLKPAASTDGQGIRRFDSAADLQRFLRSPGQAVFKDNYMIQPFIPGFDLGFSALCHNGELLAYTIQQGIISASERFGPLMAMEYITDDDVFQTGRQLLADLRWSGVAHIDLRRDQAGGQAKILEINARFWGSLLGSLTAGVNFSYLACLAALDSPFPLPSYQPRKYAHTTTAVKEGLLRLVGKNKLNGITWRETGLKFFLNDPLPEFVRQLRRR